MPALWELVCRNRKRDEHVAARHVVTFDVATDDLVVYSMATAYSGWSMVTGTR